MNSKLFILLFCLLISLVSTYAENSSTTNQTEALISRAYFEKEFEPYLRLDPLLLTIGGCKIFKTPEGGMLLVAVGMTSTKGKSWLKIHDDIGDKPYEQLARFASVKVSVVSKIDKSTTIVIDNGREHSMHRKELIKKIVSYSENYFHQFPTIGHWFSSDGETYYLAVGKYIELKNE